MRNTQIREWTNGEVQMLNSPIFKRQNAWVAALAAACGEEDLARQTLALPPMANVAITRKAVAVGTVVAYLCSGVQLDTEMLVDMVYDGGKAAIQAADQEVVGGYPTKEEMVALVSEILPVAKEWATIHPYPAMTDEETDQMLALLADTGSQTELLH